NAGWRTRGNAPGARDQGSLMLSDPIVALATPPGRSAVALLRLSGRGAFAVAERVLTPWRPDPPRTVFRARLAPPGGAAVDDCLAVCFPAPHSYTGEDVVEISTPGGLLAPPARMGARGAPRRGSSRGARCSTARWTSSRPKRPPT